MARNGKERARNSKERASQLFSATGPSLSDYENVMLVIAYVFHVHHADRLVSKEHKLVFFHHSKQVFSVGVATYRHVFERGKGKSRKVNALDKTSSAEFITV